MESRISEVVETLVIILLIIFGIFIAYQLLNFLLGGSWNVEDILISLNILVITSLFVVVGFIINMSRVMGRTENSLRGMKRQFSNLTKDFKRHLSSHK